jgi:hypothetical protein
MYAAQYPFIIVRNKNTIALNAGIVGFSLFSIIDAVYAKFIIVKSPHRKPIVIKALLINSTIILPH